jgi:hypothetical protein
MDEKKTWSEVVKDGTFVISMCVVWQFFAMVMILSFWPSKMADQAKIVVLQTYAVVFSGVVGYWVGVTLNGRKPPGTPPPEVKP